ncbi:hypothetical protein JTB14_010189 [Gonioctena quinquepunctata]|nr:hypothetical protein JTB14_010189 [Gonioctena quinquepunctata]
MANQCPVAEECSTLSRTMNTTDSNSTPLYLSSFFDNSFYDSLVKFMLECTNVVEEVHNRTGRRELSMTPEEKQVKIQELMDRIAEKERELSQLEEERRNMMTNYDASGSSAGTGPAFSPPRRTVQSARGGSRRIPRGPYQQPGDGCLPECEASCNQNVPVDKTESSSTYKSHTYLDPMHPQRRITSTPIRRASRPPAFHSSVYSTSAYSNSPYDTNGGVEADDSTINQWYQRLNM